MQDSQLCMPSQLRSQQFALAFAMWCDDFARHVDPEEMVAGLGRAFELVSDATQLQSFLALRKLDDFWAA
jgi:hypothetical protein